MKLRTSILSGFLFICALTFLCGCSDNDENEVEPQLSISPQAGNIIFSADGNTAMFNGSAIDPSFTITTNQASWEVNVIPEDTWCTIEKMADKTGFIIKAQPNTITSAPETATVTITAGNATPVKITVNQHALDEAELSVSPQVEHLEFSFDGTQTFVDSEEIEPVFTVITDQSSWNVVSTPEATWLSVAKNQDQTGFTISADPNNDFTPRPAATITVSAENAAPIVITVTQQPRPIPELSVTPHIERMEFSLDGSKAYSEGVEINSTFLVTSEQPSWDVELVPATASQWFTLTKKADNSGFTVSASANNTIDKPMATIRLTAEHAVPVEFVVTQKAIPTFKVGDLWPDPNAIYENKVLVSGTAAQGIVYWLDDTHEDYRPEGSSKNGVPTGTKGMVLSLKESALSAVEWATVLENTYAKNQDNGRANMVTIKALSSDFSNYPAFKWVHELNEGSVEYTEEVQNVWYLGAHKEMILLRNVWNGGDTAVQRDEDRDRFNSYIDYAGGAPLKSYYYWLSHELRLDTNAAFISMGHVGEGAGMMGTRKTVKYTVRGILEFSR